MFVIPFITDFNDNLLFGLVLAPNSKITIKNLDIRVIFLEVRNFVIVDKQYEGVRYCLLLVMTWIVIITKTTNLKN